MIALLTPFTLEETSIYFVLSIPPLKTHQGHKDKRNDHQLKNH